METLDTGVIRVYPIPKQVREKWSLLLKFLFNKLVNHTFGRFKSSFVRCLSFSQKSDLSRNSDQKSITLSWNKDEKCITLSRNFQLKVTPYWQAHPRVVIVLSRPPGPMLKPCTTMVRDYFIVICFCRDKNFLDEFCQTQKNWEETIMCNSTFVTVEFLTFHYLILCNNM